MDKTAAFEAGVIDGMDKIAISMKTRMSAFGQRLGREAGAATGYTFKTKPQRFVENLRALRPSVARDYMKKNMDVARRVAGSKAHRGTIKRMVRGEKPGVGGWLAYARSARKGLKG